MRITSVCNFCGSEDIVYLGNDKCYCNRCEKVRFSKDIVLESPCERTRNQVYASGNKWAIENFNATH